MAWEKVRISIPDDIDPADRLDLADDILTFIKTRTQRGVGLQGKFPAYTKAYKAKKGQSKVDLTLSSEML